MTAAIADRSAGAIMVHRVVVYTAAVDDVNTVRVYGFLEAGVVVAWRRAAKLTVHVILPLRHRNVPC